MNGIEPKGKVESVLAILQVINLLAPHLAHVVQLVRHPDGSATITMHLDSAEAGFEDVIQLVERWKKQQGIVNPV